MATKLTTISNVSEQVIPILVNDISIASANSLSNVASSVANQTMIASGAQITIELQRLDLGQLESL